jgi:hypothetical protein
MNQTVPSVWPDTWWRGGWHRQTSDVLEQKELLRLP